MEQPLIVHSEDLISDDRLRNIVCDVTFTALKDHFLAEGKGRRPKLPSFDVPSNRLLVQLFYLKDIKDRTWDKMAEWYNKIFQSDVTYGRLQHQTEKVLKACKKFTNNSLLVKFLNEPSSLALPGLDPCLLDLGLTHHILVSDSDFTVPPGLIVTNEVIRALEDFRVQNKLPVAFTTKKLRLLISSSPFASKSDAQLSYIVSKIIRTIRNNNKRKGLHPANSFLSEPVFKDIGDSVPSVPSCQCTFDFKTLRKEMCALKEKYSQLDASFSNQTLVINTLKDEREKLKASAENVLELRSENKLLRAHNTQLMNDVDVLNRSRCHKTNNSLRNEVQKLTQRLVSAEEFNEKMVAEIKSLKSRLHSEQKMKHKAHKKHLSDLALNKSLQDVLDMDHEDSDLVLKVPGTNRYKDFVRLCFMELQGEANVSAVNCSKVVSIVAHHFFKKDLRDNLPGKSSALNFADEGHLLAKQQIGDSVKDCSHFTYSCDGTSRQKKHFLEQHITLNSGKVLSLGFQEVATDDSDTLLEACISTFREICTIGGLEDRDVSTDDTFKEMIGKMKCLMSDRASVMKAFDVKMANFKMGIVEDSSTHFLFCNAHFLLGLAGEAENGLKAVEEELILENEGNRLGRDANPTFRRFVESDKSSSVSRVIRLSAEVCGPRGDEKNGCREEWLAYCSSIGEQKSIFTSFRSNRFNCLFENATAILYHKDQLERFLTNFASNSNQKLQSILEDLRDDAIVSMISALSLFHVVFTAPYWKLMNSSTPYGHFPTYVQKMESSLLSWTNCSSLPLEPIFPEFAIESPVPVVEDPFILRAFNVISSFCLVVLRRQLADFLQGGVFGGSIAPEVQIVLNSCPLTNLTGERLFGDLDFDMGKRRRASLFLRSTINMWKTNKTSRWIQKQSALRIRKLVSRAIHHAPRWRALNKRKQQEVREKVRTRIEANKRKKLEKDIQLAELKSATMDIILSQGGLCTTKADLDRLLNGPKPLDNLKAQIRYRRLFRHEKILLSGRTKDLYERLLQRL